LSFVAGSGLSLKRAKGINPYENALWVQAEITILIRQPPYEVLTGVYALGLIQVLSRRANSEAPTEYIALQGIDLPFQFLEG
jgi:hypothetical protein